MYRQPNAPGEVLAAEYPRQDSGPLCFGVPGTPPKIIWIPAARQTGVGMRVG